MIESIRLANVGAYDATGTELKGLKELNFIFGSNGSGKTTISRVIEGSGTFTASEVIWAGGNPLETRVYNKDFVEKHFDAESSIRGIYTFGENVEVAEKIKTLKSEAEAIKAKLNALRTNLTGEDGNSGKKKAKEDLAAKLVDDIWGAKKKLADLDAAFAGLNNNKKNFCERYILEASSNGAALKDVSELREDAAKVFSGALSKAAFLPNQDPSKILTLEGSPILKKKIIGKEDVDIAALIRKLGNSDWVQLGRQYFNQLEDQCPFCQQGTNAALRQSLERYFDDAYIADLAAIDKLLADYTDAVSDLLTSLNVPEILETPYLDREVFEKDVLALRLAFERNVEHVKAKRKEPSALATLTDTIPLLAAVKSHILAANTKVRANNDTIDHLAARKKELTSQVWKRLIEDTKAIYDRFKSETAGLDKAIASLEAQIETAATNLNATQIEIEDNERKITSIKPTIDAINKLLSSFGFTNFHLAESSAGGFYEIRRADGSDARQTLSEGEKSFITFLYFYHLVGGSLSSSGSTNDKVIVFDDPVSSLDADILFIVCNLIKSIISEMRKGDSPIKQVFALTHNVYFHKEVTFEKDRNQQKKKDRTYWVVRKTTRRSEVVSHVENPIKSSYELLWREVRQRSPSDTAIQNVMRKILEHYFKFYGGVSAEDIIKRFDGRDRLICNTLLSWVNDGSHFAIDDLHMACDAGQVDRYLIVFQRIFEESDHGGHYRMMMGEDYVALPVVEAQDA